MSPRDVKASQLMQISEYFDIFQVNLELSDDPPTAATVGIRLDRDNQEIPSRALFHNTEWRPSRHNELAGETIGLRSLNIPLHGTRHSVWIG